ncbi:dihydrodipicolinate synthase family protein [Marasmitruncus massiliensis]|uniref:dihydrodipicolinate synthase family protein n=1 Tax=Marasmitruncus massiliensis TaxID=1944642 RepID=UPI000C7AEC3C|nr:dihydrodipicolinate synthase family protein [Marasmitruncus massiliensis]
MNTELIKGIIPPILTPIDKDERIDEAKLRKQVNHVIEGGVNGILAFGSNGEFYMAEEDEMECALKIMVDETKGRIPVYMGIGGIQTKKCIRIAQMAEKAGAFGVSVLQPMFLKPTEEELYQHFKAIAASISGTPMLLYNNPGRIGYTLSSNLVLKLAEEMNNIVGMKDSSGDMTQTSEFIRRTRHLDFKVFGGKDTLIYGALVHGAAGAVATTANMFPELVTSIYKKFVAGDLNGALEAQYRLNPVRLMMDKASFPVATKDMANIMGLDVGDPYRPNLPTKGTILEQMRDEIKKAGLL